MAEQIVLTDLVNLQNETSAVSAINSNNNTIEEAFLDVLSLSGTAPNAMQSNLDMNSNRVVNLPAPATPSEPLRLQDASTLNGGGTISTLPVGGTTGQVLTKTSNTNFATGWNNPGSGTVTSVGLSLPADLTVTGSPVTTSGTLTGAWATTPTGTGAVVRATSPTLVTPNLGTPSAAVLTNATGLPLSTGVTGTVQATQFPVLTGDVTSIGGVLATTISAGSVTNAKQANMNAFTIKGNATSSAAAPTDISIPALTQKSTPAGADLILIADSAASNALKYATVSSVGTSSGVSSIAGNVGAFTLTNGITNSTNAIGLNVGQIPGVVTNSSATAGNLGEYISSTVVAGSAVSLTTVTPANVTSISLTAGDWDVWGTVGFVPNAATIQSVLGGWISTTSATLPTAPNNGAEVFYTMPFSTGVQNYIPVGMTRLSLSTTTTVFLSAYASFTTNTNSAFGFIGARRVR